MILDAIDRYICRVIATYVGKYTLHSPDIVGHRRSRSSKGSKVRVVRQREKRAGQGIKRLGGHVSE